MQVKMYCARKGPTIKYVNGLGAKIPKKKLKNVNKIFNTSAGGTGPGSYLRNLNAGVVCFDDGVSLSAG